MKRFVTVVFTEDEARAAASEIDGSTMNYETSTPGPKHPMHRAAIAAATGEVTK